MASHYDVLGLPPSASGSQIRKAYRQRAKESHPDKGGSDEQFQRLSQAYEVLSDDVQRSSYDRAAVQAQESQARQHATRKAEEARIVKQREERARFVAQQRQVMMQQEKAEAALRRVDGWASSPSPVMGSPAAQSAAEVRHAIRQRGRSPGGLSTGGGRADGRGTASGARGSSGRLGPIASERAKYGYGEQQRPSSSPSSRGGGGGGGYAGVTGMDRAAQAQAQAQAAPTNNEPLLFAASEGRYYHRRHDCNELQMCSNLRTGNAYHFTVNERKSRCPVCCGSPQQQTSGGGAPAAAAAAAPAASDIGGGYAGPSPEEAERYRRQQERRRHEEDRAAAAIAASQRARYAGPTSQERARYGYMNGKSPRNPRHSLISRHVSDRLLVVAGVQPVGKPSGGVGRVGEYSQHSHHSLIFRNALLTDCLRFSLSVHSMGGVNAALYGNTAAKGSSPSRSAHPLAGRSGSAVRGGGGGKPQPGGAEHNVRLGLGPDLDELLRRAAGAGFVVV